MAMRAGIRPFHTLIIAAHPGKAAHLRSIMEKIPRNAVDVVKSIEEAANLLHTAKKKYAIVVLENEEEEFIGGPMEQSVEVVLRKSLKNASEPRLQYVRCALRILNAKRFGKSKKKP